MVGGSHPIPGTIDVILAVLAVISASALAFISSYYVRGGSRRMDFILAVFFLVIAGAMFWLFLADVALFAGVPQISARIPRAAVFRAIVTIASMGLLVRIVLNGEKT